MEEKIKELEEKISLCEKEKEEYLNSWKRERADFLNYKKEENERFGEMVKYLNEGFIADFLPVLDTMEIALKASPPELQEKEWFEGFLKIKDQIIEFLKKKGVEEIVSEGQFNPEFHEAVEQVEGGSDSGEIAEEIRKGYIIKGKVIRPARVKVYK